MNAHGHNSATSYFDDIMSGAFYSWELTLPRGTNNSILKICAIVYLFPDPVTYKVRKWYLYSGSGQVFYSQLISQQWRKKDLLQFVYEGNAHNNNMNQNLISALQHWHKKCSLQLVYEGHAHTMWLLFFFALPVPSQCLKMTIPRVNQSYLTICRMHVLFRLKPITSLWALLKLSQKQMNIIMQCSWSQPDIWQNLFKTIDRPFSICQDMYYHWIKM